MPKTRPFNQRSLVDKVPESFGLYSEGICRSLVSQWLAARGHLGRTRFVAAQSRDDWRVADEIIKRDMDEERIDMIKLYVVAHLKSHKFALNQFHEMSQLFASGGGYYLALKDPTNGAGHALGIFVAGAKWRVFDPNEAAHSGDMNDVLNRLLTALIAYAKGTPAPLVGDKPAWRLTEWEVEEVAV